MIAPSVVADDPTGQPLQQCVTQRFVFFTDSRSWHNLSAEVQVDHLREILSSAKVSAACIA
jgi:hypothetical protein